MKEIYQVKRSEIKLGLSDVVRVLLMLLSGLCFRAAATTSSSSFCVPLTSGNVCYIQPNPANLTLSWSAAQQWCKVNLDANLPILLDPTTVVIFSNALTSFGLNDQQLWLGANFTLFENNTWKWLDGTTYSGTVIGSNNQKNSSCAYVLRNGTSINYYASPPYVCMNEIFSLAKYTSAATCATNQSKTVFTNGQCYQIGDESGTWYQARNNVWRFPLSMLGKDLTALENFLVDGEKYWIGLRSSSWDWQDAVSGVSFEITPFDQWPECYYVSSPNGSYPQCLSYDSHSSSWIISDCMTSMRFVCQQELNFTTTTSSTLYTTSAAIRDSSTNQLLLMSPPYNTSLTSDNIVEKFALGFGIGGGLLFLALFVWILTITVICLKRKIASNRDLESRRQPATWGTQAPHPSHATAAAAAGAIAYDAEEPTRLGLPSYQELMKNDSVRSIYKTSDLLNLPNNNFIYMFNDHDFNDNDLGPIDLGLYDKLPNNYDNAHKEEK